MPNPSTYPNLDDASSLTTFDLTITNSLDGGGTRNMYCETGALPVSLAANREGCRFAASRPTSDQHTRAFADIQCLGDIPLQITNETYEDQIGIYTYLIQFAIDKQAEAQQFYALWYGYHYTCYQRGKYNWFGCSWCCSNHPKDSQDANTCKTGRNDLIQYANQANNIAGLWDDLVASLLQQQETMLAGMNNYNLNQTMQAEFTALLAQVNEQIAVSNAVIQQTELQLLQLKKDELQMKASYIVAPLLLIIGIALVFNKK